MKKQEKNGLNIFSHQLVPKHEILSAEDTEVLIKDYHIRPYQLPFIRAADPAVVSIDGKSGDIIKITRKSPTAGECVVYRYVVEG
ncbi:DNA-directed RNA polymerase subunit H [[Eubacterium] cellulosolvens]